MADIDRETCRRAAAECVELARITNDPAKKEILLTHAQEWLKLAYAKNDAEFGHLLDEMNDAKMAPVQRQPMQQQMQQQQTKTGPKDEV